MGCAKLNPPYNTGSLGNAEVYRLIPTCITAASTAPAAWQYWPRSGGPASFALSLLGKKTYIRPPHRQRLRPGMITDDAELEAAQKVQTVLIALSPSTPSSEAVVSQMRNAAQLAAKAAEHNFSSEAELNNVRAEAGLALIGVIGGLEDGSLTEGALYRARDAVRAWIGKLVAR